MLKRRSTGVCGLALVFAASLGPSCKKSTPPQTELLVTVSSLTSVERLEFVVRSNALDSDQLAVDLEGRDLTANPYELVVRPSSRLSGHLFIAVKGYRAGAVVAGLARFVDFTADTRVEVAVTLVGGFVDADGDGFPAWGSVPGCTAELCDCDDSRGDVSPFRPEVCADPADNNCVGGGNWDDCPCAVDDPPVPCTNLSPGQYPLSGVGACAVGFLRCVDEGTGTPTMQTECSSGAPTDEISNNFIDDDCDGVVDEGGSCTPGTVRRCHLGFVDDAGNPTADERTGATKRLLGECAKQPADWPASTPFPVQRCLNGAWSSVCEGDVLPQRAPPLVAGQVGFYFAELPNQCDGLDNDCDGLYDENAGFDSDGDGYTLCGTTFAASPTDPQVNTHTLPGTSPDLVDCDDASPSVHPTQIEVCGNTVDEDCRCDHEDPSTQVDDIGRPLCKKAYGALDCSVLPRSDQHPVGNCRDAPTYYRGFVSDSKGRLSCYVCNAVFGKACSTTTGACTSKDDDCAGCPLGGALLDGDIAEARPICRKARVGTCSGPTGPVWDDLVGEDPFHDCGAVSCAGWHFGVAGYRCYDRADVPASTCKAGGQCEGPADLCVAQTQAAATPLPLALCTMATDAGCSGNLPYAPTPQPAGEDYFDACNASYVCSSTVGSEGPFYAGLADLSADGVVNPQCYFHADVANNQCNGSAACQSRAQACLAAPQGGAVPGRPVCMAYAAGSCLGAQGPGYTPIAYGDDPYGDCGVFRCNGKGGCQLPIGSLCTVSNDCEQGSSCIDGRCCNTTCGGVCQACSIARGGAADGTCGPIVVVGTRDTFPTTLCSGATGCTGTSCACDGTGLCKRSNGQACGTDGTLCASGNCVDGVCCGAPSCGTCQSCSASGNGTCAAITAAEGRNCNGDCSSCVAGTCTPRAATDFAEVVTACHQCNGSSTTSVTQPDAANGYQCSGQCTSCVAGTCVTRALGDNVECAPCHACGGAASATCPSQADAAEGHNCSGTCSSCVGGTCAIRAAADNAEITACAHCDGTGSTSLIEDGPEGFNCAGDCSSCSAGTCTLRQATDHTETPTCRSCTGSSSTSLPDTADNGYQCTSDCSSCVAGVCTPRAPTDHKEIAVCAHCDGVGFTSVPETAAEGFRCSGQCTECVSGTCTTRIPDDNSECATCARCDGSARETCALVDAENGKACTDDCSSCVSGTCTARGVTDTTEITTACTRCNGVTFTSLPETAAEGFACSGPCTSCDAGDCVPRLPDDTTECGTCTRCDGTALPSCAAVTADNGKGCSGPCTSCNAGACDTRLPDDTTECGTCTRCDGTALPSCAAVTADNGKGCSGPCTSCNAGACDTRLPDDNVECSTCARCDGTALTSCAAVTADNGKGCSGDCSSCVEGNCTARAVTDHTEITACANCDGATFTSVPETGGSGYACSDPGNFCCGGQCAGTAGGPEYGAFCGTGDAIECMTMQCSGTSAQCTPLADTTVCHYCSSTTTSWTGACASNGTTCAGGSGTSCGTGTCSSTTRLCIP